MHTNNTHTQLKSTYTTSQRLQRP